MVQKKKSSIDAKLPYHKKLQHSQQQQQQKKTTFASDQNAENELIKMLINTICQQINVNFDLYSYQYFAPSFAKAKGNRDEEKQNF